MVSQVKNWNAPHQADLFKVRYSTSPSKGAPPLNTSLSQTIEDAYQYKNSPRFENHYALYPKDKKNSQLIQENTWYVVDATETKLIAC